MSSSSAAAFSQLQDHHLAPLPSEQLCYVHCNFCDTVLAVSVPYSSLLKTVAVRCGHCSNVLSVNMRGFLLPAAGNHPFLSSLQHNLLEEALTSPVPPSLTMDQPSLSNNSLPAPAPAPASKAMDQDEQLPQTPVVNRPPEKRQRVPSAYNRFIKDEIQRIKAGNPDITHREAFSAAAKNWAHFPHIHFGLMPDQAMKKTGPEGEGVLLRDTFFTAAAANMGVAPF